jgi:hypothetical protein
VARVRIHGATRRQVITHYEETDKPALRPLAAEHFALFQCGTRTVHPDGHVEIGAAFYPVPLHLVGADVEVRWDSRLVRVFHEERAVAVHGLVRKGVFAPRAGGSAAPSSTQRVYITKLLAQCARVGPELGEWAEAAYAEREIRSLRLIQGVLGLLRRHPKEAVLAAARTARQHRLFRYRERSSSTPAYLYDVDLQLHYPTNSGFSPYVFAGGGGVTVDQENSFSKAAGKFGMGRTISRTAVSAPFSK